MGKKWLPLESNPEVLNDFVSKLGYDTSKYSFCDVFGLDEELLQMVPQPVVAVLFLFPVTKESEAAKEAEDQELKQQGYKPDPKVYFMKQTISNACGTIGALHAIANNKEKSTMTQGSFLNSFLTDSASMDPEQRGRFLEEPPQGAPDIDKAHEAAAQEGDTAPPALEDVVDLHFVALVNKNNRLVELDGRKSFPIDHGKTSDSTILQDSVAVLKKFMANANTIKFNLIALAKTEQ